MLTISEFSKISGLSKKALHYYGDLGLLTPKYINAANNYRYYDNSQLVLASKLLAYRQLNFTIEEIKEVLSGADEQSFLEKKVAELEEKQKTLKDNIRLIKTILDGKMYDYNVTVKTISQMTVCVAEEVLKNYNEIFRWIPELGRKFKLSNHDIEECYPQYKFCEFLDEEYRESDVRVRHVRAVKSIGVETEEIKFKTLTETKVLSILVKGEYKNSISANMFLKNYALQNGYKTLGLPRFCLIDGIWNKENPNNWISEIQLPIK